MEPTKGKPKPPEGIEVFYDVRDGSYWYRLSGRYVALKKSDLFMHLRALGLSHEGQRFDGQTQLDWVLYNAQLKRMIDYAGSLGGHRVGTFKDGSGRQYLVTDEARGIWEKPAKDWKSPKLFPDLVNELLPGDQSEHFFWWLAIALRSLRRGDFRPGQVLVFAGPVRCGKSLLQYIITEVLGGRAASPMRYMMEETSFNKDLAGAEHWLIEEPKTTTDTRTRVQFGNAIKECFNNRDFSIHAKGKEAITLPIFRRGTISVNDDPDLLIVIPPLNGSVDDKLCLYQCQPIEKALAAFQVDKAGEMDRAALWSAIMAEVPAIRAWLLANFKKVPASMKDDRFGIVAYHEPNLRAQLVAFAPEMRLLTILDELFFSGAGPHAPKQGRALELEKELRRSEFGFEAEKMLRYANQFASYLGKLAKIEPNRVTKHVRDGYAHWEIKPPSVKE